jgi:hypothetical protein
VVDFTIHHHTHYDSSTSHSKSPKNLSQPHAKHITTLTPLCSFFLLTAHALTVAELDTLDPASTDFVPVGVPVAVLVGTNLVDAEADDDDDGTGGTYGPYTPPWICTGVLLSFAIMAAAWYSARDWGGSPAVLKVRHVSFLLCLRSRCQRIGARIKWQGKKGKEEGGEV